MYSISVIIRTKNEAKTIGKVLQRLKDQEYDGPAEIIVVDSSSTDKTVSIAQRFGCHVINIKPEDFSFGRALNIGIEHARGEIIVNLSGHSVPVNTDYFTLMVKPFEYPNVAATFGRDIPWPEACPSQTRDILNHFPETGLDGNKFSNANAALRRDVWKKIRFDEQALACEDLLWAKKVMPAGYSIVYVPLAKVFHSHSSSIVYIFKRYLKERMSVKHLLNLPEIQLKDVLKHAYWQTLCDFNYIKENGISLKWYFHVPFYRLSQELGLYIGCKLADRRRFND